MEGAMIFAASVVPNPAMLLLWNETSYSVDAPKFFLKIFTVNSADLMFHIIGYSSRIYNRDSCACWRGQFFLLCVNSPPLCVCFHEVGSSAPSARHAQAINGRFISVTSPQSAVFQLIVRNDDSKQNDLKDMSAHLYLIISQTHWTQVASLTVLHSESFQVSSNSRSYALPERAKKENALGGY